MNKVYSCLCLATLMFARLDAATIIRGFEDRPAGSFTTQYAEFTITTDTLNASLSVYNFVQYASEGTNFLTIMDPATGGATANGIFTAAAGYELLGVSVNGVEAASGLSVANISLFSSSGTTLGVVNILAPGVGTTPVHMDFSSYGSVGRFEIRNITDIGGFAIDRIVVNAVPEPSALSLLAAGLVGGIALRRVRRRTD
ncbi:MAG: PEP-CTERM sorting domain-containing protein [Verrucomicrobia bacterium]|nr:PEP-CTERM sorting domain-containing protein [Verrucomicrobiota bacterium]